MNVQHIPGLTSITAAGIALGIAGAGRALRRPDLGLALAGATVAAANSYLIFVHKQQIMEYVEARRKQGGPFVAEPGDEGPLKFGGSSG